MKKVCLTHQQAYEAKENCPYCPSNRLQLQIVMIKNKTLSFSNHWFEPGEASYASETTLRLKKYKDLISYEVKNEKGL